MAIARWAPLHELDSFERRMRRLFEDVGFAPALLPAANVFETGDEFVVELEVPGFDEKELAIEVSDHTLTVKGERAEKKDERVKAYRLRERLETEFERRFVLPAEADTEHVTAEFRKGVLEVHAPKTAEGKPRTVKIAAR